MLDLRLLRRLVLSTGLLAGRMLFSRLLLVLFLLFEPAQLFLFARRRVLGQNRHTGCDRTGESTVDIDRG